MLGLLLLREMILGPVLGALICKFVSQDTFAALGPM